MAQIGLRKIRGESNSFALGDLGTLRMDNGLFVRRARAQAGADDWRFERRGMFTKTVTATDAADTIVGGFSRSTLRIPGPLTWAGRQLEMSTSFEGWRGRWLMRYDQRPLAGFETRSEGDCSVIVTVDEAGPYVPPGLLLFGAFIARVLEDDDKAAMRPNRGSW